MAGLKRYLLFAFDGYYPDGGWSDFIDHFDDLDSVNDAVVNLKRDYWHVIDTHLPKPDIIKFGSTIPQ